MKNQAVMKSLVAAGVFAMTAVGCQTMDPMPSRDNAELVWSSHENRPSWMDHPDANFSEHEGWSVVGRSVRHATERSAIAEARRDAMVKAVTAIRSHIEVEDETQISGEAPEDEVQVRNLSQDSTRIITANGEIGPIRASETYLRAFDGEEGRYYTAAMKIEVPVEAREAYESTFEQPGEGGEDDAGATAKDTEAAPNGDKPTAAGDTGATTKEPVSG